MAYCNHCKARGVKVKLLYQPEDKAHPFRCPECGAESWFLDKRTGTIKEEYSEEDIKRQGRVA